jgi:hypothetical protein
MGVSFIRNHHVFVVVPFSQKPSHRWVLKEDVSYPSISFVGLLEGVVGPPVITGQRDEITVYLH